MNIQSYRVRFIAIAMTAMTACLVVLLVMINVLNGHRIVAEQKDILTIIAENDGSFPTYNSTRGKKPPQRAYTITEESEYRIRYFHATWGKKSGVIEVNLQHIAALDEEEAIDLVEAAAATRQEYGVVGHYIFKAYTNEGSVRTHYVVLDWQEKVAVLRNFILTSVIMGAAALAATFLIVLWLSKRAIRPVVISTQKQQQFITDASHELKTPLTAISVNMEVLALEIGENEWLDSTNEQVGILRKLVDQLIGMAQLDESAALYTEKQELDMVELVSDAASYFAPMAEAAGRAIELDVPEHMTLFGNEELLWRMISVLCDNAIKHATGDGSIKLALATKGKAVILRVQNPWPISPDSTVYERMFDRFYKADPARRKDGIRDGFGVGLSIAQKAAQWHGGSIHASPVGQDQICFIVVLRSK